MTDEGIAQKFLDQLAANGHQLLHKGNRWQFDGAIAPFDRSDYRHRADRRIADSPGSAAASSLPGAAGHRPA